MRNVNPPKGFSSPIKSNEVTQNHPLSEEMSGRLGKISR
jgi:hypothetical protein